MGKPAKPVIIVLLIGLLVLTGYINHGLTLKANSRVSSDYQRYEELEMAKNSDEIGSSDRELVEALSKAEEDTEDIEIIDTLEGEGVDEISEKTNKAIGQNFGKEASIQSKNYFIEQRLSRDKLRANLIDRLNEIVKNENTTDEMRNEAQLKIISIGDLSEKELTIEGLIKAKGFEEALVFLTDDNAKVIVSREELSEQDVVKILDIVIGETNLDASNIKIMKKY